MNGTVLFWMTMLTLAVLVRLPSETWREKLFRPFGPLQGTAMSAVTVPFVFTMFVTFTLFGAEFRVTTRLPAAVSASETVATTKFRGMPPFGTLIAFLETGVMWGAVF